MVCFHCAAGQLSAIGSCLITEGLVDEHEPVCSVSSPSPGLRENTALLRTFARGQQQFPALLPAAHATTGKSLCLSRTWGATSSWLPWEQTCQSFSNTGLRGLKCIQPPPAETSAPNGTGQCWGHWKGISRAWFSAPEMSGARTWGERSPLGSTAVQTASLTFAMFLAAHSLFPSSATSLLFQKRCYSVPSWAWGFVRSLLGAGTRDTSLPSYLASLLHLFSIASIIVSQIYYLGIQTVPLHTYVNSKLPHR